MCYGFAADDVGFACDVGEVQEAAEVVILIENAEEDLRFRGAQLEGGEGYGLAETRRNCEVTIYNFAEIQHGLVIRGLDS